MNITLPDKAIIKILECSKLQDIYNLIQVNQRFYENYHNLDFIHIYNQIKLWPKAEQLKAFVGFYSFLPAQGSHMWLTKRQLGIGGSEMSVITGENPYKDMRNLIAGKTKLPEGKFEGNVATRWGNVFEPVLDMYISFMLNTVIHETGSIPGVIKRADGQPIQNYSPDGLALVQKKDYKYMIDQTSMKYDGINASSNKKFKELPDELILLFEFKNPFRRVPQGSVKQHYVAQPKAGMCTIPITDAALFVDGVFRKCSIRDFDLGRAYDTKFHCIHGKCRRLTYETAIACGFIGIIDTSKPFEHEDTNENDWNVSEEVESFNDESSEFESEEIVEMTQEECASIAKLLSTYCIKEVKQHQSDYYELKFELCKLPSVTKMLLAFLSNVLHSKQFADIEVSLDTEINILIQAIRRLFIYQQAKLVGKNNLSSHKETIRSAVNIAKLLVPDLIEQLIVDEKEYDFDKLNFGDDYGETSMKAISAEEFESMIERVVNDRFVDKGLKLYYPNKFFFDVESPDSAKLMRDGNYIDYTLEQKESATKWLYTNVEEFVKHCQDNNVRPLGILPWKMFEVCAMPMYKEPDFLKNHAEAIRDTIAIIDEIQKIPMSNVEERLAVLNEYYKPPRVKTKRTPVKRTSAPSVPTDNKKYNQETMDFFADLE